MPISLEGYLNSLTQYAARRRASNEMESPMLRKASLTAAFKRLIGEFPEKRMGLEPQVLERTPCDGYLREHIEITTMEGLRMAVYILVPDRPVSEQASAIIACHGHGYGNREIVGLEPDGKARSGDPGLHKDFAVSLVKEGYIVAAPELLGFGDRRLAEDMDEAPGKNSCFRLAAHMLLTGRTLAGHRIYETTRVIDYLQSRNDVIHHNIAVMGISGGGLVAGFTAALDERIRCAVVSGYASLFAESILSRSHCLDNYIPGILLEAEIPELLGLIAPRGLFLESGEADRVFPRDPAVKAYGELQKIYITAGASNAVRADFFEGGHEIHGGPAYAWLREQLLMSPKATGGDKNDH